MATPDAVQTLLAAFSFGILLEAATGALLIYSRGHGSNIFKDGQRLALVLFLFFSVLWAQINFLELLIPATGTGICQVGLVFTTGFDQLARVAFEQFLLWSIGHGTKIAAIRAIMQGLLAIRLIMGVVLVGFTRPQFAPTCVANTSILPVAIVVLVMDFIIVGALLVQASSLGMFGDRREDRKAQSRALLFVVAGFMVWTITSVPMILGIPSIILIARTMVPADGLLVLVGIVAFFPVALLSPKPEDSVTASARSPFSTSPMVLSRGMFQNGIGVEGSPVVGRPGNTNQLFVVNPSKKLSAAGNSNASGYQSPGGIFPAVFAASPLASVQAATAAPAPSAERGPISTKRPKVSVRDLAISKPIVNDEADPDTAFARIATIDLKTAAMNDRERRSMASKKSQFNSSRAVPLQPTMAPKYMENKNNTFAQTGPQQNAAPQSQTVMLMNDIIYDNPEIVQSIISKTPGHSRQKSLQELSPLIPYTSGFQTRESVIHRPRPIPRRNNGGMFGNEALPGHRRSKSGSSISTRKSLTPPDSPSQIPPLPKLPSIYTASKLEKLLPNDTKSMTVNEKLQILFPAPPEVGLLNRRRSSAPDLPTIIASKLAASIEPDLQGNPNSKQTTTIPLLSPQEYPPKQSPTGVESDRETYCSSVLETLVPGHNSTNTNTFKLGSERLSSGSYNSNVRVSTPLEEDYMGQINPVSEIPIENDEDEGDEIMVIMMDSAEYRRSLAESVVSDQEPFIFDINGLPVDPTHSPPTWHRRIGDKIPTFSDRRPKQGCRKISPPTALILTPLRRRTSSILMRNASPSPKLDSPRKALQEIQDQLDRIEEPGRSPLESILRRMSDREEDGGSDKDDFLERLLLLENLEMEMREQENDWQMRKNSNRDSISSISSLSTPQFQASPELTRSVMETAPSQRLSLGLRRSSPLRSCNSIRDSMSGISVGDEIMSPQIQESSSLGDWQQRLANAQISYMENAPASSHSRNSSINFLSAFKDPDAPMGSPPASGSEPESEPQSEYESEGEIMDEESMCLSDRLDLLWQPMMQSPKGAVSELWSSTKDKPSLEFSQTPEPPAKNLRPARRRSENEMLISSADLWSNPSPNMNPSNVLVQALWRSTSIRASTVKARPVTQRPPRRSKRITVLADIVENPEPLPNKRDTLGIFQFPWGERSDAAVSQPTYNSVFQSGSVLNATFDSRSRQLEPELSEYSGSSFFDDDDDDESEFDDEDDLDEDELDDGMDTDSDDEFDETILWEIASMLNTTNVPSKNSLLPPTRSSQKTIHDYDNYEASSQTDFISENEDYEEFNNEHYEEYKNDTRNSIVIFSQDDDLNLDEEGVPDMAEPLETLDEDSSQDLFGFSDDTSGNLATALGVSTRRSFMWTPTSIVANVVVQGLFQPASSRVDYRTTDLEPPALSLNSKKRSMPGTLTKLVSNKLWHQPCLLNMKRDHDWISESSIRPSSPSIASDTSSGRSSPDISDASSMASTSTKASSLFYSGPVSMQRLLSAKQGELIPQPPPPADPSRYQLKLPVRQVSLKPTPNASPSMPFKQSKVMSSRGLFETEIPAGSENHQLPRFCRSVVPIKSAKPTYRAMRHQHRPTIAFRANWKDALNEAIIAGLPRSKATAADWDLALAEAVTSGTPHVEPPQVSMELPESNLTDTVATRTASFGSTYSEVYNPSMLHPVFFTKTLVSDVNTIHPAAIGHTKLLRLSASFDDWDQALGKVTSMKTARMQRPTAFAFMWKDVLKEAIAAGTPKKEVETPNAIEPQQRTVVTTARDYPRLNVASLHPVFFTNSMISSTNDIHPAALGYVQNPKFNSAVLHPVFFTTTLVSTVADIHPTCIGHTVVASSRLMSESSLWTPKSTSMTSVRFSGLWTDNGLSTPDLFSDIMHEPIKRVFDARGGALSRLESSKLFTLKDNAGAGIDWLRASVAPIIVTPKKSMIWAASSLPTISTPDLFADVHDEIKTEIVETFDGEPIAGEPTFEELISDVETLTEEEIAELLSSEAFTEKDTTVEPTFEELISDVESLTEEEIAELLSFEGFT
ncbi:hypothetical protein NHQ30_000116 [Ciborinia camelliae]|nr:hypothetical protein NHQ30_000116 [Ciborinia camelliae]